MTTSLWVTLLLLGPAQTDSDSVAEVPPANTSGEHTSTSSGETEDRSAPARSDVTTEVTPAPSDVTTEATQPAADLEAVLLDLLDKASDPVRVVVAPIKDEDKERGSMLGTRVARVLITSSNVDVVTASRVRAALQGAALAAVEDRDGKAFAQFSADHVVLGEVITAGGAAELNLRLLHVESGQIVAQGQLPVSGASRASSVQAGTVRGALRVLAGELAAAMEGVVGDQRYQRLAVAPLSAQGSAVEDSRLERFAQAELLKALAHEGFLVVERERFDEAMAQFSLGAQLGESNVPEIGQALDAQAIVVGSVSELGENFLVNVRIISVGNGEVLGAATAKLRRENAISLASRAIETRTPGEAFFRSAVFPGWGQFYNQQPVKAAVLGGITLGAAVVTVALIGGAAASWVLYQTATPDPKATGAQRTAPIVFARVVRDVATYSAVGMMVITSGLWGATAAEALVSGLYAE